MPSDLPSPPGWYPDPYQTGSQRWFDGTEWTTHAVPTTAADPDAVVVRDWQPRYSEELRRGEQFSENALSIPRDAEPAYDGGGGYQGVIANRAGRYAMRLVARWGPVKAVRWFGGLTVLLAICAWGDPAHRVFLAPLAAVSLVATVIVGIREARERARWNELGRQE